MAEKPEDLNLPHAVIARLIKEVVGVGLSYLLGPRVDQSKRTFLLDKCQVFINLSSRNSLSYISIY